MPGGNSFSVFARVAALVGLLLASACGGGGGGGSSSSGGGSAPAGSQADLVVTSFSAPSSGVAGSTYTVSGTVTNQGSGPGVASAIVYLSAFENVEIDGGLVGLDVYLGFLDPGQSWSFAIEFDVPDSIADGSYHIGVVVPYGPGAESNTGNNMRSQPFAVSGGTACAQDAYEADNAAAQSNVLSFGVPQTHNHCDGTSDWLQFAATAGTTYSIATSNVGREGWTLLSLYDRDGETRLLLSSLPPSWEFGAARLMWTAPASGTYYVRVAPTMGLRSGGAETDYEVTLGDLRPDLVVSSFFPATTGLPGGNISAGNTVLNQGFGAAGNLEVAVYLSTDATVTTADARLGARAVSALAVGESSSASAISYALPADLAAGTYYLAAIANPGGSVSEYDAANNTSTVHAITIQNPGSCAADAFEPDDTPAGAQPLSAGAAAQAHNHCDDVVDWLSFAATGGETYALRATAVGGFAAPWLEIYAADGTTRLAPSGGTQTGNVDWTAPASGTYFVKAGGNRAGTATEYAVKVERYRPDLTEALQTVSGNTVPAGGFLDINDLVSNLGYTAAGAFEIGIYASTDNVVTTADTLVARRSVATLAAIGGGTHTNQIWHSAHFPRALPAGAYYLAAIADHADAIVEGNEANNVSAPVAVNVVAPACAWDAYEDDDSTASAKPIAAGATQSRNFCDDGIDWLTFTPSESGVYVAKGGGSIAVHLSDAATVVAPHATDTATTSWAIVAQGLPAQGGKKSQASFTAAAGGTYYIRATVAPFTGGFGADKTYTLSLD
ncbi:MAG TPA: CARDB domain-containing protein [Burkholderiaceae bacterium]|nr:CARDB domain-containing protein [Burkholderiaceae bacterium]